MKSERRATVCRSVARTVATRNEEDLQREKKVDDPKEWEMMAMKIVVDFVCMKFSGTKAQVYPDHKHQSRI